MLTKTIGLLRTYAEKVSALNEAYASNTKNIVKNYNGGLAVEKQTELQNKYNADYDALITSTKESISAEITVIENKINSVANESPKDGFIESLTAFKLIKEPSKAEMENMINLCGNCYLAFRGLFDVMGADKLGYMIITLDAVTEALETVKNDVREFTKKSALDSYKFANIVHPNGTQWTSENDIITNFCNHDFKFKAEDK